MWSVQVNVLLSNCKKVLRHCFSWLARQYIDQILAKKYQTMGAFKINVA